jgi:hypothetical protein
MNNNCIGGVIVSSAVDSGFKHLSRQTEDYKHVALRRKNKHWLALNQDNVSEWGDMLIRELLFQAAITIKIQLCMLV